MPVANRTDPRRLLRDVGRRIAEARRRRGLTQEQLAELLRVSERYLRRIEAGEENLTLMSLARIADKLGTPVAALLDAAPEPPKRRRPRPTP